MKHYLVKRTAFNPDLNNGNGGYDVDTISMHQKVFDSIVSQKDYQESLRNNAVATPLKLEVIQEFKDHHDFMEWSKKEREKKAALKNKKTDDTPEIKQYTEKGLKLMKPEKLVSILVDCYKVDPAILEGVEKETLIASILDKQNG